MRKTDYFLQKVLSSIKVNQSFFGYEISVQASVHIEVKG
jgi:hypothetical protein